jgi:hypothetical protein
MAAIAAISGCRQGPPRTGTQPLVEGGFKPAPGNREHVGSLTGRVTLEGQPVENYAIIFVERDRLPPTRTTVVRDREGRFNVDNVPPGVWDVVVVGAGFARHLIPKLSLSAGPVTPRLDIEVARGYAITGIVRDDRGAVVNGAKVVINTQGNRLPNDSDDYFTHLYKGTITTSSTPDGKFQCEGIPSDASSLHVRAQLDRHKGTSYSQRIFPPTDNVEVIIYPEGAVEGLVSQSARPDLQLVVARPVSHPQGTFAAPVEGSGTFKFERLPVGEYEVGIFNTEGPGGPVLTHRIRVEVGKTTSLKLNQP